MVAQAESNVAIKIARMRTHEVDHWRRITEQVGLQIDLIIHPETETSERIMRVVGLPGVSDIVDFADGNIKLFGMNVEPESWFSGKTLEELDASRPPKNSLIALIFRGQQVIIPHGAEVLRPGDHIYVMGTRENLDDVLQFMGVGRQESVSRVFIVGGKQLGIGIAEALEKDGVQVKLFERDTRRCRKISTILEKTVVIHGDGTEQGILEDENVEGVNAFLAMTPNDETNIILLHAGPPSGGEKSRRADQPAQLSADGAAVGHQHVGEPAVGGGRSRAPIRAQGARSVGDHVRRRGGRGDRADRDRGIEVCR